MPGFSLPGGNRRAVASGRVAAGTVLQVARAHLQKAFLAFVVGLVGTIYAMRLFVWDFLKDVTTSGMTEATAAELDIVVRTPFDVILLQVKFGTVVGGVLGGLVLLYYVRRPLRERELWPSLPGSRRTRLGVALTSLLLFVGGVVYGYELFFPFMFEFLTRYTLDAGFAPTYDLVAWTEFVLLLTLSFGLAAQMPLAVTGLSYLEVVPYETFRSKWRHAVVAIFVFGAVFSPPDPFTQLMWAIPLVVLYGFSLLLAKAVVTVSRTSETVDVRGALWRARYRLVGLPVLAFAALYAVGTSPRVLAFAGGVNLPYGGDLARSLAGVLVAAAGSPGAAVTLVAVVVAAVVLAAVAVRAVFREIAAAEARFAGVDFAHPDLASMDAATVRALPLRAFRDIDGQEMLAAVKGAVRSGDKELGEAILQRYDEARTAGSVARPKRKAKNRRSRAGADGADDDDLDSAARRRSADVLSVLTEEEVDEDDVGGYYHDILFVVESLTAKSFRLVAVFGGVMALVFFALYAGGVSALKEDFLSRVPADVVPAEAVRIVALHPVEVLLFAVKVSVLAGLVATLPVVLYYAWPALSARGFARGNRDTFLVWGVALLLGFLGGSVLGYLYVAPTVISYLAWDAIDAGAVVSYRVGSFFWLVFFTTAFVGVLASVPVTMWLFHRGGVVRYDAMREHWRVVVVFVFLAAALGTPNGIVTMLLVALPVAAAYLVGLGALWLVTLGERRVASPTE
ncbi:twin-arginine translocase subunit TatC [Halobium salinum]|uniref:Twin-arginine translocase subunit TatC n=1 Tax=Halobium salinum TaxID=1364940 RepID=A0ABD5PBS1_9EURY|nr:twin-arginine translocase subunit TatC [Halobium salinum]